ncbi:MAG TPA: hypothetical protein VM243_02150 [Phycisphaerae bacterium]|nr:hypothetical protein [Phycisphaerae bacterium]
MARVAKDADTRAGTLTASLQELRDSLAVLRDAADQISGKIETRPVVGTQADRNPHEDTLAGVITDCREITGDIGGLLEHIHGRL